MIEAWLIYKYEIDNTLWDIVLLHEKPDEYYYGDPSYRIERIVYTKLENNK